jgi:chemotaxis protein CheZ
MPGVSDPPEARGEDVQREPPLRLRNLQGELHAMKDAIAMTKREIASLQQSATGREGMHRAACELDAVAEATERATTTILGAVEEIETAANMLRAAGLGSGRTDHVGTILDRVVLLYETCNFQDLTGQRIEKVVDTMKFVEGRLDAMITAWGGNSPGPDAAGPPPEDPSGRRLASGPCLPGEAQVSQTDIDAIFT